MSRPKATALQLTQRALRDIQEILNYSREHWGKQTADKYFGELEAALQRIKEHPDLLNSEPDLHPALVFYRVNRHLFVCDRQPQSIVVLTVLHSSMDVPGRLAKLQPSLAAEIAILHRVIESRSPRKRR